MLKRLVLVLVGIAILIMAQLFYNETGSYAGLVLFGVFILAVIGDAAARLVKSLKE